MLWHSNHSFRLSCTILKREETFLLFIELKKQLYPLAEKLKQIQSSLVLLTNSMVNFNGFRVG